MDDPLDNFFGISSSGNMEDNKDISGKVPAMDGGNPYVDEEDVKEDGELFVINIEIPENAELSDITKLALEAYKSQIDILKFIEPKYRNRGFEVAQQYLTIAQNAIKQDVELKQKRDRLILDREKADLSEKGDKPNTTSKENLYSLVKKKKA